MNNFPSLESLWLLHHNNFQSFDDQLIVAFCYSLFIKGFLIETNNTVNLLFVLLVFHLYFL